MTLDDERGTMKAFLTSGNTIEELPRDTSGRVADLIFTSAPVRVLDESDLKALSVLVTSNLGLFETHRFHILHSDVFDLLEHGEALLNDCDADSRSYVAAMRIAAEVNLYHQTLLTCGSQLPAIVSQWPQRRRDLAALVACIVKEHSKMEDVFSYGHGHELELAI